MMIDRLGGIDPLKNLQNTQKTRQTENASNVDSIAVSQEARVLSEVYLAMETVRATPDIREEKVAEVSKKLEDPAYVEKALRDMVSDSFLEDVLGV